MKNSAILSIKRETFMTLLIDSAAILVILLAPALAHLLSFPVFYVEPMRIMLILALVHTNRKNAYALAIALPLISFAVSAHPVFFKSILMSAEFAFNVFLFFELTRRMKSIFPAVFLSILISKMAYYLVKIFMLNFALFTSPLISIPIWVQLVTASLFALYAAKMLKDQVRA